MSVARGRVCVAMVVWLVSYKKITHNALAHSAVNCAIVPLRKKTRSLGMMKVGRDMNGYRLQQSQNGNSSCSLGTTRVG